MTGFIIWIVEDQITDTEPWYLEPLERLSREDHALNPFPEVKVIQLSVSEGKLAVLEELRKRVAQFSRLRVTVLPRSETWESDPDGFLDQLVAIAGEKDVFLIDRTVKGLGWPDAEYAGFVFNGIRARRPSSDRVFMITHTRVYEVFHGPFSAQSTVKWDVPEQHFAQFKRMLSVLFEPPDWTAAVKDGGSEFTRFFRDLAPQRRRALDECAKLALLNLLLPTPGGGTDLIEVAKCTRHQHPASPTGAAHPKVPGANDSTWLKLLRRRVLYGLRRLWDEFNPSANVEDYAGWLEVVAADYDWYCMELRLLRKLQPYAKKGKLYGDATSIDLVRSGLQYDGRYGKVTRITVQPRKDCDARIRREGGGPGERDGDGSARIRFVEGDVEFPHGSARRVGDKYWYQLSARYDAAPPRADGASPAAWNEYWSDIEEADVLRNTVIRRNNHVELLYNGLSNKILFKTKDDMLAFSAPMKEELEWWSKVRDEVVSCPLFVERQQEIFDMMEMSIRKWEFRHPPGRGGK